MRNKTSGVYRCLNNYKRNNTADNKHQMISTSKDYTHGVTFSNQVYVRISQIFYYFYFLMQNRLECLLGVEKGKP